MATSDEFQVQRFDRKRKRETAEEETLTMETEQNSSAQFPQINPAQLQVKMNLY
jgi:hypothetical protein